MGKEFIGNCKYCDSDNIEDTDKYSPSDKETELYCNDCNKKFEIYSIWRFLE